MKNFDYCKYTYRHRKAFKYVVEKLFKDSPYKNALLKRALIHDMDKMIDYQIFSKDEANVRHRARASHHIENRIDNKTDLDLYEMIVDFESAGYTKPDKPMNAYDYIWFLFAKEKINEEQFIRFIKMLHELKIDDSYSVINKDPIGFSYINNTIPTEEDILKEIQDYLDRKS